MRYYREKNIPLAKTLRKAETPEERHLWYDFLSGHPAHFRRQTAFGPYIVDFVSLKARLIIELDGEQHYTEEGKRKDAIRTEYLNRLGYRVQRYDNFEITRCFDDVCREIDELVIDRNKEPKTIVNYWTL